ncbi:MAG: 16S rRNA (adenine(1518)-N(6)/adenine(1519)-N(6))-dimethyltransferase RsmA, partial [Bacteroidota bacterium]
MQRPKKSLGQNFLQDSNVSQKIVRLFDPQPSDAVVEIGPGKGALTALLTAILPHLTVIELDNHLIGELQTQFGEKISIIHSDILKVDISALAPAPDAKIRLIGNIPYNITTPILFHVIDHAAHVKDFVVMMQTEVAQRLTAKPRTKEYGILSIFLQYYCAPKILFSVSKNSFFPIPAVSSTVVHLNFDEPFAPKALNDALFRKIVRGTFNTRRKTLRNGLRNVGVPHEEFEKLHLNLEMRPEELSVADFVQLSN